MSKVTTVSRGWQLECKVVSKSRLGIILAILWQWTSQMVFENSLVITCTGPEVKTPPSDDQDCTAAPLPSWASSQTGSQENPNTTWETHPSLPDDQHRSRQSLHQLMFVKQGKVKQSEANPTSQLSSPDCWGTFHTNYTLQLWLILM